MPNKKERALALRWAMAYHEAGHAVMACLVGRHLKPISIDDDQNSTVRHPPILRIFRPDNNVSFPLDDSVAELQFYMVGAIAESLKISGTSFVEQRYAHRRFKGGEFLLSIRDENNGNIARLISISAGEVHASSFHF